MLYENFKNGINIGGWFAQYNFIAQQPLTKENLENHFSTFITEKDFLKISEWGYDHIRLPIDSNFIYESSLKTLKTQGLRWLHQCIEWCKTYHLNIVLDLHDTKGNIYGAMDFPMPLLTNSIMQEELITIWQLLAKELRQEHESIEIMFEILNEVSDASGTYALNDIYGKQFDLTNKEQFLWNRLYKKIIEEIRKIDPARWILVGSNGQNSIVYLKELEIVDDPLVFYNFHYYDPQVFTHQQASFSEEMAEFDHVVHYPDDISEFTEYLNEHPSWKLKHALVAEEKYNNYELMEKLLNEAVLFIKTTNRELYCGEFGVISHAPAESAKAWLHDLVAIFDQNNIGHALWTYKHLDFGLLDINGKPMSSLLS